MGSAKICISNYLNLQHGLNKMGILSTCAVHSPALVRRLFLLKITW